MNDYFLQIVRAETHRGLEGRALKGFWTGGRVYGYATIEEPDPENAEHPRKLPVINPQEAEVVRRIFSWYAEGLGTKKIAAKLNEDGIPAPYDGKAKLKTNGRGWGHTTVRNILQNERYVGLWIWNKRKWVRVAGAKNRTCMNNPESEWKIRECPELAIVTQQLWDTAQSHFRGRNTEGRGRRLGAGKKSVYLLSGIIRCGLCNSGMGIIGSKKKAGKKYITYGCTAHYSRGDAICTNDLTLSELKATKAVTAALTQLFSKAGFADRFVEGFRKKLAAVQKQEKEESAVAVEKEIAEADKAVRRVTQAIARLPDSEGLLDQLQAEEARLKGLRAKRATMSTSQDRAKVIPHPKAIEAYLTNLLAVVTKDSGKGHALLRKHLGTVLLTPKGEGPDRHYVATGAFFLSTSLNDEPPEGQVLRKVSCGGAMPDQTADVIPFQVRVFPRAA